MTANLLLMCMSAASLPDAIALVLQPTYCNAAVQHGGWCVHEVCSSHKPAHTAGVRCGAQVQAHLYESVIKQEMARRQKRAKAKSEPKIKAKLKADVPKVNLHGSGQIYSWDISVCISWYIVVYR
jgi:hypothetical protein